MLLITTTTWDGEGAAEVAMPLSARSQVKSRLLTKEASQVSVLGWSGRTEGSTLEVVEAAEVAEGEEEALAAHQAAALADLAAEAATAGRSVATGPRRKIENDGIYISVKPHPH